MENVKKSFITKTSGFIQEVRREILKVVWPTRHDTTLTTIFVFVFALIMALYFMVVDQFIYRILHWIIG